MNVTVVLFGALRGKAGRSELRLDLPAGATVAQAIAASGLEDRVDLWVLVDGERAGRERLLAEGAQLTFFQPVGGG